MNETASEAERARTLLDLFDPGGIPYALVILLGMALVARLVTRSGDRIGERFANRRLVIQQAAVLVRFTVYLVGVLAAVLTLFTLTDELLLALGGTFAVAAGFALKDVAASVLAGLIILVDRPFQVGDRVTFGEHYGEITQMGLRSVRLRTLDDSQVTIPNNRFLTEAVVSGNAGSVDMMVRIDLHIGAGEDLAEARRLLGEAMTTSRFVNLDRPWRVSVQQVIGKGFIALRLRGQAYVLDARFEKAFESDVTERALEAFREAGVREPAVLQRG